MADDIEIDLNVVLKMDNVLVAHVSEQPTLGLINRLARGHLNLPTDLENVKVEVAHLSSPQMGGYKAWSISLTTQILPDPNAEEAPKTT